MQKMYSQVMQLPNLVPYVSLMANLFASICGATLAFSYAIFSNESELIYIFVYCSLLPMYWMFAIFCMTCICIALFLARIYVNEKREITRRQFIALLVMTNVIIPIPPYLILRLVRA